MKLHSETLRILEHALSGNAPNRKDCLYLLDLNPNSFEAAALIATADTITRKRFANQGLIQGQIGIGAEPCPGKCQFCTFGSSHAVLPPEEMRLEEIVQRAREFTAGGILNALFLMTMHKFDFDALLNTIEAVRAAIPPQTRLVVNIGDFDASQAETLRRCGVTGAYHVLRLREGVDTGLDPEDRVQTIEHIRKAGLDWYYCCEPVGPEHSSQELVDQLFLGVEMGCFQHAAMRRIGVANTPLRKKGQITNRRLAQVTAVVALASLACSETKNIAVHEPNLLGLTAGANVVYAETGVNPRDQNRETSGSRGFDVNACRQMLAEAGFEHLLLGDGRTTELSLSLP